MDEERIRWHAVTTAERERIREAARRVLARHPWVKAAWLYGSAARGDRPSRDIDVGILADPIPHWREPARIAAELAADTGIADVDFDVREVNAGSPVFLNRLLSEGELLYEADRDARIAFQASAMARWLDFKPLWERARAQVLERWSRG